MDKVWDRRFLQLAKFVAHWSKDPSTQTGAVIVDPFRRILSMGFNGFPRGIKDDPDRLLNRDLKYKIIVHCERNAILFAQRSLLGCTLYTWPMASCAPCAAMVIQAGITRCVAPPPDEGVRSRWEKDLELSGSLFHEAGVILDIVDYTI